ncbi:winged helix DNA-binding domain-containing protein [Pseudonocardia sp. DSM 110487]|uniref:winged helix DNA-binding domain-containing protein n=1 Tax=Pseudonocardia sp. DSM 110487 TaxID=2865833 RepID=UPI001C6A1B24|nr:winged helix DNA-binding domain-containing protein [Pseudonocardia sp. DSM 110487]QYN38571.1 winged helix DNA-binding domain-containing protein [Pseudonocardia sp. DSM 110487]
MTWRQVVRWRLRRQLLVEPAADALAVARRVCGLHAQVASCTELIAGIRSATPPDLDTALWRDRSLVRTWAMRGTLHLLPADELDVWVGARTDYESRRRFPPSYEREHGVTGEQVHAITEAVGEVLGAEPLSRAELAAAITARLGDPALAAPLSTGWGAVLKPAASRGLLCSGPSTDGAVSFVNPAAWLGRPLRPIDPSAANREVLLRFLTANGPATAVDVARWWGDQPAPARRWFRENADALTAVEVDGEAGFVVRAEDADELAAVPDSPEGDVVLLPGFDPWVIAPRSHRERAVPPERTSEVSRTAGWISPVLVVDGAVAAVWEHERRDGELAVTIRPFSELPAAVREAVHAPAARYAALLGATDVSVGWG